MKEKILYGYTIFFIVVSQLAALGAPTLFSGMVENPSALACQPTGVLGAVTCFFSNIGIFFKLMTISSSYAVLSSIFVVPFVIIVVYIIVELVAKVIP